MVARDLARGIACGDWTIWSEASENQLNTLYSTFGVPLTYVIHEIEILDETTVYSTFIEDCIARAPFIRNKHEAYTRQVHQLILSCTQGESLHKWIKPLMKNSKG